MHGGQAMLKAMQRTGIDYIFSSPGSEWPPVWEALAEQAAQGIKKPGYINCRHEAVAVAMAGGYIKVTNRPQVVMLHATAGPLNAAMTLRAVPPAICPMVTTAGTVGAISRLTIVWSCVTSCAAPTIASTPVCGWAACPVRPRSTMSNAAEEACPAPSV